MTKRRPLTRLQRVKIFDDHKGICQHCGLKIHAERGEKWEAMHIVSLWAGGKDEPENMAPGHLKCHAAQTRDEAAVKAKSDRVRANYLGIKQTGRPMPGSKASPFKKRMDGRVERRTSSVVTANDNRRM